MTHDDKIAAGWVETSPGHWRLPDPSDADLHAARSYENGFGQERIVTTADGFALRIPGWRTASVPLTAKHHDHRSMLADPARRAAWRAERSAESRARSFQIAARRAQAIAEDTAARFLATLAESGNVGPLARVPVPRVTVTPRRRKVWHRMTSANVVLADINGEYRRAIDDQSFGATAADFHRERARVMFSPVRRAANAESQRARRARIVATETAEERTARLAIAADKARAKRAALRAETRPLTAADATA